MKPLANMRPARAGETLTRWVKQPGRHAKPSSVAPMPDGATGTRFPNQVKPVEGSVLVSGHNNIKIGRDVRKGRFRGYWIYSLSLEERATCPSRCRHWSTCYGNAMPFARRVDHTDHAALCEAIEADIRRLLAVRGREGILIRLHALGDFYSVEYVRFWRTMMALYPRLAVWGYTARNPQSAIGDALVTTKALYPDRFRIRWSDGDAPTDCTVSIDRANDCPPDAFVCPEQTGATLACATCGACWSGDKNVAFVAH